MGKRVMRERMERRVAVVEGGGGERKVGSTVTQEGAVSWLHC